MHKQEEEIFYVFGSCKAPYREHVIDGLLKLILRHVFYDFLLGASAAESTAGWTRDVSFLLLTVKMGKSGLMDAAHFWFSLIPACFSSRVISCNLDAYKFGSAAPAAEMV